MDGGDSWKKILEVDEFTGANELVINPENPDSLVVSTYQRHRRIWALLKGAHSTIVNWSWIQKTPTGSIPLTP